MNDLLADFMEGEGAQPLPPAPQRTSAHHSRTASAPAPPEITRQRSWARSHSGSEPARDPSTGHQRSSSSLEKGSSSSSSTGFLAKYRAARLARKSRGSKDITDDLQPLRNFANGRQHQQHQQQHQQPSSVQQLIADSTQAFLQDTTDVKELLGSIKRQQVQVEALHQQCKLLTSSSEIKEGRARCQEAVEQVTRTVKKVRDRLNALEELNAEIATQAEETGQVQESPEIQMRITVMSGLSAKLQETCAAWGIMRAKWAYEERAEVGRQLYTVTGQQYSDDELQEVVDSGGQDMIYQQALMAPGQQRDIKGMLSQIEQRHTEMQALEQAMLDLYQVFLDMSVVVVEQAEQLDRIENWVLNTKDQMSAGLAQLIEAKAHRRRAAQKKAITFVSGVGLIGAGAGISATGAGAVIGIPMAIVGAGIAGAAAAL